MNEYDKLYAEYLSLNMLQEDNTGIKISPNEYKLVDVIGGKRLVIDKEKSIKNLQQRINKLKNTDLIILL